MADTTERQSMSQVEKITATLKELIAALPSSERKKLALAIQSVPPLPLKVAGVMDLKTIANEWIAGEQERVSGVLSWFSARRLRAPALFRLTSHKAAPLRGWSAGTSRSTLHPGMARGA
jgi:hypothetical protein